MKILKTILLLVMGTFMFTQPVGAIISSTHASATTIEQQSAALKTEFKAQKKLAKFEKFFAKVGVDTKDPVKKWLWFANKGESVGKLISLTHYNILCVFTKVNRMCCNNGVSGVKQTARTCQWTGWWA